MPIVSASGPTLSQHWFSALCLLGCHGEVVVIVVHANVIRSSFTFRHLEPPDPGITIVNITQRSTHHALHTTIPVNLRRSTNIGMMLVQRRRRWANIIPILFEDVVFALMAS